MFCAHMYESMCETQLILSMHKCDYSSDLSMRKCDYSSESHTAVPLHTSFIYLYILSKSHSSLTVPSDTYLQLSEYIEPFQRIAEWSVSVSFRLVKETLGRS